MVFPPHVGFEVHVKICIPGWRVAQQKDGSLKRREDDLRWAGPHLVCKLSDRAGEEADDAL